MQTPNLQNASILTIPVASAQELTTDDLKTIASTTALEYGLNPKHFLAVIQCESQFNPASVSPTGDFGIAQINARAHPEITKKEMLDPLWSLDWMAKQWSLEHYYLWSCWKKLKTAPPEGGA